MVVVLKAQATTYGGVPALKTWIHSGATPWKTCYIQMNNSGGSGYLSGQFWWTPGTNPSYIPVLRLCTGAGALHYENADNTVSPGFTNTVNRFCLWSTLLITDPTYYGAIPVIYSAGGSWWEVDEDVSV